MRPYSDVVLDHFHNPRNAGALPLADAAGYADLSGNAPRVTIFLKVENGNVVASSFVTFGCGAMIACCSMITEMAKGRSVKECRSICAADLVKALAGVPHGKEFCADICVRALSRALDELVKEPPDRRSIST